MSAAVEADAQMPLLLQLRLLTLPLLNTINLETFAESVMGVSIPKIAWTRVRRLETVFVLGLWEAVSRR